MSNADIITNWLYKKINVPLVENNVNYIVLLTEYSEESDVSDNSGMLADIATVEFMKYYFPELWYPYIDSDAFASDMGLLPNSAAFTSAAQTNAGVIFNIIRNNLFVSDYKKSSRPGSTYKVYVPAGS